MTEATSNASLARTYDEFPYQNAAYRLSQPDRLATIATIFGMTPAPIESCRVLELGCCGGGNLIPLAEQFPNAQFVGFDLSARQISDGCAAVAPLKLKNLRLEQRDILDLGPEIGTFDYIIAHGVFSWVPPIVQDKLLAICRQNLADQGVAYVSYNVKPGWHVRGVVREMMLYHIGEIEDPVERLRRARFVMEVIAPSVPSEAQNYAALLKQELEDVRQASDKYLLHDHLEEHNLPVYFHEFMGRSQAHGLQYLGESDVGIMALSNLARPIVNCLNTLAKDLVDAEQYLDFVTNRQFRHTLLCRREVTLNRHPPLELIQKFRVASEAKAEGAIELEPGEKVKFRWSSGVLAIADPLLATALAHLGQVWPASMPMSELIEFTCSRVGPVEGVPAERPERARHLTALLLRQYFSRRVDFSIHPDSFVTTVSKRPVVAPWARLESLASKSATSRQHLQVVCDDFTAHILRLLDGTRDRDTLIEMALESIRHGRVALKLGEKTIEDGAAYRQLLSERVDLVLRRFADLALLIG